VSKHLQVLRSVGLVDVRREGRQVMYQINPAGLRPIHEWTATFEQYWSKQLNRIKQHAEAAAPQVRPPRMTTREVSKW